MVRVGNTHNVYVKYDAYTDARRRQAATGSHIHYDSNITSRGLLLTGSD